MPLFAIPALLALLHRVEITALVSVTTEAIFGMVLRISAKALHSLELSIAMTIKAVSFRRP